MRVAVAQFESGPDKTANYERIAAQAEEAASAGARLVVFPEGAMHTFGALTEDLRPVAEPLDGPFVGHLGRLASRLGLTLVVGMFESVPGDQRIHNTAVVVDPRKGLVAAHRKRHLYDAFGELESDRFRPGDAELPIVEIDGFSTAVVRPVSGRR